MGITIDINADKVLNDLSKDLIDEEGLIRELTMKGESYCKMECPKDTGDLSRSITSRFQGNDGVVKTDLEYAKHVIYGTSAHEITVKNKKVLSDRNSGSTKPNNFPARAVKQVQGEIPGIARKYVKVKQ